MSVESLELSPAFNLKRFDPHATGDEIAVFVESLRPYLRRVVAVFNGKGGQGKTSLATHTAGLLAEAEVANAEQGEDAGRVLVVEVDSQGNTLHDLGIKGHPANDKGESLMMAIQYGHEPKIIADVRPRLDVIPSGTELEQLPVQMVANQNKYGRSAWLSLAVMLAKLSRTYRWIIIDCPPVSKEPQQLALCAARWVVTPVSRGDSSSIDGLSGVANRFRSTQEFNPDLELLGAVLFGFRHQFHTDRTSGEKRAVGLWVEARARVEDVLRRAGSDAPVFESVIRNAERVAVTCRDRGQLTYEIGEATDGIKWWEKAAGKTGSVLPTDRAEEVGRDYEDLVIEMVERVVEIELEEDAA